GAGKGLSPIFYITIGSGIGGGLIINGEIYRGVGRGAAEIGHLRISRPGGGEDPPILPLETYSSGWGVAPDARFGLRIGGNLQVIQQLAGEGRITAQVIGQAAAQGDEIALRILNEAWVALAEGITHVIALLCPRRIVIGGGVAFMGEKLLFGPLRRLVA